jgi:hypothetical protein
MMPRAANRIIHEEPLAKWGAVVRADGTNREQLIAAPDKEHRFAARVAEQHGSVSHR